MPSLSKKKDCSLQHLPASLYHCIACVIFTFIYLQTTSISLAAQSTAKDSLLENRSLHFPRVLYLTTDKTIYSPNETIWFAAYLLQRNLDTDTIVPDILSVTLLRDDSTAISVKKNYLIENGTCSGSLLLPEQLTPGSYRLIAFSNAVNKTNGFPLDVFKTSITVQASGSPPFSTHFSIDNSLNDTVFVEAQVTPGGADLGIGKEYEFAYHLANQKSKSAKLRSQKRIRLGFSLAQLQQSGNILYTSTRADGITRYFNLTLPRRQTDSVIVRFFPEGGNMVTGIKGRIAWQAYNIAGSPLQTTAVLQKNGQPIDTIHTAEDGTGIFVLQPETDSRYTLQLSGNAASYPLPPIVNTGAALQIDHAVAADTLPIIIRTQGSMPITLSIKNVADETGVITDTMQCHGELKIRLALGSLIKGLHTITVIDAAGRPLAERLFFAHYSHSAPIVLQTNKTAYTTREKITATINTTDTVTKNAAGLFTISCVRMNRVEKGKKVNIRDYFYLHHWLESDAASGDSIYHQTDRIERMLLVKGWRRYTWPHSIAAINDSSLASRKLLIEGKAEMRIDGAKLKKPLSIVMKRDSSWSILTTDNRGLFTPDAASISITEGRKLFFKPMGRDPDLYTVPITDPMQMLLTPLQRMPTQIQYAPAPVFDIKEPLSGDGFNTAKQLQTVVVRSKPVSFTYANECGDYVCSYNILNCPNHFANPGNRLPVKGEWYNAPHNGGIPIRIMYAGCGMDGAKLGEASIYTAREFYGIDSTILADDTRKEYLSTIYWKPFEIIANGKKESSFYSSDLTGSFKIFVEGITAGGELFYEEKIITVQNP